MLCEELSRPPTQEELVRRYLDLCKAEISEKGVNPDYVANRIARAWATYVGELDFYSQVRDSGLFDKVILDTELDYKLGYNLGVVYKRKTFYIHLYYYYKERRGWAEKWIETKDKRKREIRTRLELPDPIEFPLTDEDADVVGGIHLYTAEHVQKLRKMLADRKGMPSVETVLQKLEVDKGWMQMF